MPVFSIAVPDGRTVKIEAGDEQTAMTGAQEWFESQNQAQEEAPVTAGGTLKSVGAGLARGVAGVVGLPRMASDLMGDGINYVGEKMGFRRREMTPNSMMPTADAVTGGIEKITGPLYKPQNTVEEYANTLGEFAPGVLFGGPRQIISNVIAPALASETAGQLTRGTEYEPYARGGAAIAGSFFNPAQTAKNWSASRSIPSTQELKTQSGAAYKAVDDAGVVLSPYKVDLIGKDIFSTVAKEGIDPTLHPKAMAALKRVDELSGRPATFETMETVRKVIKDAASSTEKSERRVAKIMQSKLDSHMSMLSSVDVVSGNPQQAAQAISKARDLWSRSSKSETIENLIERANIRASQFSGSGKENALRTEFRQLAMNKDRMRVFSQEEQKAIKRVAMGGPLENALRMVGKFAPTGVVSTAAGTGLGGYATGDWTGAAALPILGMMARGSATAMTSRNANRASQTMRAGKSGLPQPAISPAEAKRLALVEAFLGARSGTEVEAAR